MVWLALLHIFSTILELVHICRLSDKDKDLEIMILRHQLDVMTRLQSKPVKPNRVEKLTLAILTTKLNQSANRSTSQLRDVIRIIKPETVIRWHRELVRRKWTLEQKNKGGRPRICKDIENLTVHLAQENHRWGYAKIEGELLKLGYKVSPKNRSQCPRPELHCASSCSFVNESHLRRVLWEFIAYYNTRRPHQGFEQQPPILRTNPMETGIVNRHRVIGASSTITFMR